LGNLIRALEAIPEKHKALVKSIKDADALLR